MIDSGGPHGSGQVYLSWDHRPLCCFSGPRLCMVLHQGALQDTGKGAEGANYGGAAGAAVSSSEGSDYGGLMSWARRRSE